MKKKTQIALLAAVVILAGVAAIVTKSGWDKKGGGGKNSPASMENNTGTTEQDDYPPSTKKTGDAQSQGVVGTLGGKKCMEKFTVERDLEIPADKLPKTSLQLESLETFQGGAFFGKIEDYSADKNFELTEFIDKLMMEKKISTYEHLKADVCLYNRDFLNPDGGGRLNYYVEHYYCTNHCQTGNYGLTVNLNPDGSFVGYRSDSKW